MPALGIHGCSLVVLLLVWIASPAWAYDDGAVRSDQQQAQRLLEHVPVSELLGPLAPIALSPFFGMTCLSGITILVNQGVLPDNRFLTGNEVLNRPDVFWVFLFLTLLTSLPRLTKVSKPVAQLADLAETYSVLVVLVVIHAFGPPADAGSVAAPALCVAGFGSVSWSVLIAAASVANVIVIQTVRAFFEFVVWVSPFPLVDALFEGLNKTLCAALMLLYAYSPGAAFALDLALFLFCLLIFGWAHRRLRYYRHVLLGPLWAWLRRRLAGHGVPAFDPAAGLLVFPASRVGPLRARSCCRLHQEFGIVAVRESRWLGGHREAAWPRELLQVEVATGLLANVVTVRTDRGETYRLHWSRTFNDSLPAIAKWLGAEPGPQA